LLYHAKMAAFLTHYLAGGGRGLKGYSIKHFASRS
jgi:hypothetical protein